MDLEMNLKALASSGHVLNCQELAGLQAGLTLLQGREKYQEIYLWGKVFGHTNDYYIAYGMRDADFEFPSKAFYYAGEDFEFRLLERLTEDIADQLIDLSLDGPFTGDAESPLDAGLRECHRLSQVVQEIDFDTAAVPRGSYALNEAQAVVPSGAFSGLSASSASSVDGYVHFRPPTSVACLRALAPADVQFYSNFLDPLEGDLPKGCWALRQDPLNAMVTLRSLTWPGYVAFHVPSSRKFGGVYFGYGQKNRDLPFIL